MMNVLTFAHSTLHMVATVSKGCHLVLVRHQWSSERRMKPYLEADGVEVIFDDIIIAAKDDHEHDEIMRTFLQRAREANVKFNPAKSVKSSTWEKHLSSD